MNTGVRRKNQLSEDLKTFYNCRPVGPPQLRTKWQLLLDVVYLAWLRLTAVWYAAVNRPRSGPLPTFKEVLDQEETVKKRALFKAASDDYETVRLRNYLNGLTSEEEWNLDFEKNWSSFQPPEPSPPYEIMPLFPSNEEIQKALLKATRIDEEERLRRINTGDHR